VHICAHPRRGRPSRLLSSLGTHSYEHHTRVRLRRAHAICSNIAGGITPESTPVEITSAGSVHDVTGGFSNESAAHVVNSFALDPSTTARPGLSSGLSTCVSIALVAADRSSSGSEYMACGHGSMTAECMARGYGSITAARSGSTSDSVACGYGSTTAVYSNPGSECMACGYGSMTAARSSSESESVACGYGSTTAARSNYPTTICIYLSNYFVLTNTVFISTNSGSRKLPEYLKFVSHGKFKMKL
jgi:hypothetical protein